MPFVWVRVSSFLNEEFIEKLAKKLPIIVAKALNVPGTKGTLKPEEIEVKVESFGPLDVHTKNIEIIIWANDYPERRENLNERRKQIVAEIGKFFSSTPEITGFVWVLLQPGSYGEF